MKTHTRLSWQCLKIFLNKSFTSPVLPCGFMNLIINHTGYAKWAIVATNDTLGPISQMCDELIIQNMIEKSFNLSAVEDICELIIAVQVKIICLQKQWWIVITQVNFLLKDHNRQPRAHPQRASCWNVFCEFKV